MKKNLLLLSCSCLLVFLAGEWIARLFFPQWAPRAGRMTQFWRYDSRYGWSNVPGAKGAFQSFGFDTNVTINDRGFRGPLIPYERTPGKKRVEILGDSYVWGYGVNENEMFTALLPQFLNSAEVVNLGVTGYSTDQELMLYEDEGYKYNADYVVLVFCMNDVDGNTTRVQYATYEKPVFVLDNDQLRLENQPVKRSALWKRGLVALTSHSYLINTMYRVLAEAALKSKPQLQQAGTDNTFPASPGDKLTARLIHEFSRAVAQKQPNSKFLVVLVEDMAPKYAHEVVNYLAPNHIDALSLGDHVDHNDRSLHLPDENHWSPSGNRLVAKTIADFISHR